MKKSIIIIFTILIILGILFGSYFIFIGIKNKERQNMIKIIKTYISKNEYERALDNIDKLLKWNPDDLEVLNLQDMVLELKNKQKELEEKEKEEKGKLEKEQILESMASLIDKTESKPQIIIEDASKYSISDKKENEKYNKIKKFISDGIKEYNSQNFAKAKDNFLKALELDENNAEANAYLGISLYDENPNNDQNVQEAIKRLKKALKNDSTNIAAQYKLAQIYNDQNLYDAAIEEYKKVLTLDPKKYEAYFALAKIYYNQKEYLKAEENFIACIKLKPDFVNALVYLGVTELRLNKTTEAKFYLNKAISFDSSFAQAHSMLGEVYKVEKNYQSALVHYRKAAELTNQYKYHQKVGDCYNALKQFDKAIESYILAVSLNPLKTEKDKEDAIDAYENIAEIERNRGRYKESLNFVNKGLELTKESYFLYYLAAFNKSKLGMVNDAILDYLNAIRLNPEEIILYINLSKLYNENCNYEEAIKIALKGLQVNNKEYKLYNNLGDSYQKTFRYNEAIQAYNTSISLNPSDPIIYYNLGVCYFEIKDYENAINCFQKAISINQDYYDAYFDLGQAYFASKKYPEAKSIFLNLLKKKPDYPKRDQIDKIITLIPN